MSVITDSTIMFLVHEDDETTQIAQVVNSGLDVAAVIRLGVNLDEALALSNGHTKRAPAAVRSSAARAPRALPAPDPNDTRAHKDRARDLVLCPDCEIGYRRSSLAQHLRAVHSWRTTDSQLAQRNAVAVDPREAPRSSRGGYRGSNSRAISASTVKPRQRVHDKVPPGTLWPNLNSAAIVEYVRRHPGVMSREIAIALADESPRATKTVSNRCDQLTQRGQLRAEIDVSTGQKRRRYWIPERATVTAPDVSNFDPLAEQQRAAETVAASIFTT